MNNPPVSPSDLYPLLIPNIPFSHHSIIPCVN
jgi:hypothetical protein